MKPLNHPTPHQGSPHPPREGRDARPLGRTVVVIPAAAARVERPLRPRPLQVPPLPLHRLALPPTSLLPAQITIEGAPARGAGYRVARSRRRRNPPPRCVEEEEETLAVVVVVVTRRRLGGRERDSGRGRDLWTWLVSGWVACPPPFFFFVFLLFFLGLWPAPRRPKCFV